jgi:hypothetical protein
MHSALMMILATKPKVASQVRLSVNLKMRVCLNNHTIYVIHDFAFVCGLFPEGMRMQ